MVNAPAIRQLRHVSNAADERASHAVPYTKHSCYLSVNNGASHLQSSPYSSFLGYPLVHEKLWNT